jgi:hypothetical protein
MRRNIKFRIKKLGMFTKEGLILSDEELVPFGSSELIGFGLKRGIAGGAIAADGAGTVATQNPLLVQGLGAGCLV